MRQAIMGLALLAVGGCAAAIPGSYDPYLYDANGNVVGPVAAAGPPPAPASDCREAERTVIIAGQPRTVVGTACPQPDGTWRFVE
jgi:surface antigen